MSIREILEKFRSEERICVNDPTDTDQRFDNRLNQTLSDLSAELLKDCPKDKDLKTDGMIELVQRENAYEAKAFIDGFNQALKEGREYIQEKLK